MALQPYGHSLAFYGPTSDELSNNLLGGDQPHSRVNEHVVNAYIDVIEKKGGVKLLTTHLNTLYKPLTQTDYKDAHSGDSLQDTEIEKEPLWDSWATALPGFICVSRTGYQRGGKVDNASPVIVSATGLGPALEHLYHFAGVVRSPSIKTKGMGQTADDYFTCYAGGICTILNTSGQAINKLDKIAWTFAMDAQTASGKGSDNHDLQARRIQIFSIGAYDYHPNVFGRAQTGARSGERFDVLLD